MLPYCAYNGIGVIPWGPLGLGQLTRPWGETSMRGEIWKRTGWGFGGEESTKAVIDRVEELSKKKGRSMAQIAIAWAQQKVASPLLGISSVKRLDDNILGDFKLTEEEIKYLEEP
jgi:aryl-alcohol dehydrogenase-like predicted oxidoreductase